MVDTVSKKWNQLIDWVVKWGEELQHSAPRLIPGRENLLFDHK